MIRSYIRFYGFNKYAFIAIEQGMRTTVDMNAPPGPGDEKLTAYGKWAENREYNRVVKNYPFSIRIDELNGSSDDMSNWCFENCNGDWYFHEQFWLRIKPTVRFKEEDDLIAFKLRWA